MIRTVQTKMARPFPGGEERECPASVADNSSAPLPRKPCPGTVSPMTNALYYGDNFEVLRDHIGDASVDLL